jgi:hypothetical protein
MPMTQKSNFERNNLISYKVSLQNEKENVCKKDLGNSYIKGISPPEILSNENRKNTKNKKSDITENINLSNIGTATLG